GWSVLALTGVIRCWLKPPPLEGPQAQTGGRPRRGVRLAKDAPKAQTVAEDGGRGDRRSAQGAVEAPERRHRHDRATDLRLGAGARDRTPRWGSWPRGLVARPPRAE